MPLDGHIEFTVTNSKPKLLKHSQSFLENAYVGPGGLLTNYSAHALAWKEAGDVVAVRALAGPRGQLDYYFPVICYLYRHFVELELKLLIRMLARITGQPLPTNLTNNHSIESLLLQFQGLLKNLDATATLDAGLESMLLELHSLDPDGQRLRYLTKRDGSVGIPSLAVDVRHLKKQMGKIASTLGGYEGWLDEMIGAEVQAEADARAGADK